VPVSGDANGQSSRGFVHFSLIAGCPAGTLITMEKITFEFGDWVESIAYVEFGYTTYPEHKGVTNEIHKRELFRKRLKIYGRVAGMVYRYTGIIEVEEPYFSHSYFEPGPPVPPQNYLHSQKSHRLYLIKQGMMNKPFMCLPTDMGKIPERKFPTLWQTPWRKEYREYLSKVMKNHPRDKKGRWIKNERI